MNLEGKMVSTSICKKEKEGRKSNYFPLVYICSPFAGDVNNNILNAKKYSMFAIENDAMPLTPHLLYPQFLHDEIRKEREIAMRINYVLLGKCDELWVFGGVISRGMAKEILLAKKRKMKIRWFDHALKEVREYD